MSGLRVLVSGASVAGPALAYWLVRAGCTVTVVERAPYLRKEGQGIDVRDSARDVIKRMGIFERCKDQSSHEEGLSFVDSANRSFARVPVDLESGKGDSPTCDIEILRGELASILVDITKDNVEYIYGDMVTRIEETEKSITAHFANGAPPTAYDLIVAADGFSSKLRTMAFGADAAHVRSLNAFISYFSLPPSDLDSLWARVHWCPGGRNMVFRPDNQGKTRAFLSLITRDGNDPRLPRLRKASKEGVAAQKAVLQELFEDGDWEIERILKGMHASEDFYMQDICQVHMDRWATPSGRVTVVGDAGYAPTPFTGMGTSLAFIGAYVLAGEISRQPHDLPAALAAYERIFRPYVEDIQKLPPGIPWIVNPQSKMGIRVLQRVIWALSLLSATGVVKLFSKLRGLFPKGKGDFQLPEYEAFKQ